jgi:prenyltransferase beta subunit
VAAVVVLAAVTTAEEAIRRPADLARAGIPHQCSRADPHLKAVIAVGPLFLCFLVIFSKPVNSYCGHSESTVGLTRRQAAADFQAALQMDEGFFVPELTAPKAGGFITPTRDGVESLGIIGALSQINTDASTEYFSLCQGTDGALYGTPEDAATKNSPEMWFVEDAVAGLKTLSRLDAINVGQLLAWIFSCLRDDGGFNDEPGVLDNAIWNTYSAVHALVLLGQSFDMPKTVQGVLQYHCSDGGFASVPGGESSLQTTFYGASLLAFCNRLSAIDANLTAGYVISYYNDLQHSFGNGVFYTSSAVAILSYLNKLDLINSTGVAAYVLACQSNKHGGFKVSPDAQDEDVRNSWAALTCLATLNLVSLLSEEFAVLESPVWTGDDGTTTPTNTAPAMPLLPSPLQLLLLAAGTFMVALFVIIVGAPFSSTKKTKLVRKKRRR